MKVSQCAQLLFNRWASENKQKRQHIEKQLDLNAHRTRGSSPVKIVTFCKRDWVAPCINQLRETGYLSNWGRQIVASCFVNELGLDWRFGAAWFQEYLVDYDVGSNWGN